VKKYGYFVYAGHPFSRLSQETQIYQIRWPATLFQISFKLKLKLVLDSSVTKLKNMF